MGLVNARSRSTLGAIGLALALSGCEPRVDELAARPVGDAAGSTTQAPRASTAAGHATSSPSSGRGQPAPVEPATSPSCIEPMPETPTRTARVGPDPGCPADPLEQPPDLRHATIRFATAGAPVLDVEVAERDADRQRGLMFRTSLPQNGGMLFVFPVPRVNRFWMRNTCISLDMLFIDESGFVVGVAESTPTLTDESFSVRCKSKYVLEVPGGFCRQHGIKAGERVEIDGL
jgi:uncharacterized protein